MNKRRDAVRAWLCVLLAGILLAGRAWFLQGVTRPIYVTGGSMSPTFCGEQAQLRCSRCQLTLAVDLIPWQSHPHTSCPNCRQSLDATNVATQRQGERVLIDHAAFFSQQPVRLAVLALREPKTQDPAIKRLVALPNERWEIRRGDLLVNGELVRKTPAQFLSTAVLVHADAHRAAPMTSPWHSAAKRSGWKIEAGGFSWSPATAGEGRQLDWLTYHHPSPHPAATVRETFVSDHDPYNATLARPVFPVTDLILQGECQIAGSSKLQLRLHDGYVAHEWELPVTPNSTGQFTVALVDRTAWLLLNDRLVLREVLPFSDALPQPSSQPLAIGGAGEGNITLNNLRILRDIHYLSPNGLADSWIADAPLGPAEFAVLGDNPAISLDSRHWGNISRSHVIGRVMKCPW
jgi:hypothetical protein